MHDLLDALPELYRQGEQQDVTETLRFFFDLFGGSDKPLIRTVFTGELDERMSCRSKIHFSVNKTLSKTMLSYDFDFCYSVWFPEEYAQYVYGSCAACGNC